MTYTDGVKYLADNAGASWLIDEIAIIQLHESHVAAAEFQAWLLRVFDDCSAVLTCEDRSAEIIYGKVIDSTDFPLGEITLWFSNNVLYLPSEH